MVDSRVTSSLPAPADGAEDDGVAIQEVDILTVMLSSMQIIHCWQVEINVCSAHSFRVSLLSVTTSGRQMKSFEFELHFVIVLLELILGLIITTTLYKTH